MNCQKCPIEVECLRIRETLEALDSGSYTSCLLHVVLYDFFSKRHQEFAALRASGEFSRAYLEAREKMADGQG